MNLYGRGLLSPADLTSEDFLDLVGTARWLREEPLPGDRLAGRTIALVFEKSSTRTRCAFEVAAHTQGAHVTYLGPDGSHVGSKESVKDTARVLGRMYDGIAYRGFAQKSVEALAEHAGVPVWNALTDEWHPTQMLADILTMTDHTAKPLQEITFCYLGDARNNTANSLLVTGALLGMDARICGPGTLQPSPRVRQTAADLATRSGARITVTDDPERAVADADFLYTDVWLSMGEPSDAWADRINELSPYRIDSALMKATGNPDTKFMHCLPALHDRNTTLGQRLHEAYGMDSLEVTDEVFESPASIVFDQAENRLHTIKALMVATIPPRS